jgi:hypothetical protein
MTHSRVTSGLESFYSDHPLTFLSRNTTAQKLTNLPPTLTHLRDFLRSSPPSQSLTPEQNFANWSLTQLYRKATGNFDSSDSSDSSFSFSSSSGDSFGFLKELNPEHSIESVSLTKEDLETASLHKIMRFCVAHGVGVGHDTTRTELLAMATWILNTEVDNVSLKRMPVSCKKRSIFQCWHKMLNGLIN